MIIELKNINKSYEAGEPGPRGNIQVLHDVALSVEQGEFVCIIGPSGCGKSTLLKIISGLEAPDAASNKSASTLTLPSDVSMVFQSGALLPWRTALQNVALGLEQKKTTDKKDTGVKGAKDIAKLCEHYLDMVGLKEMTNKYPRELSGGQRQRVGLARALAVEPQVLLLDEPFSALDPKTTHELHEDLLKIWRGSTSLTTGVSSQVNLVQDKKLTIVMVSHLIEEAVSLADRVVLMKAGRIEDIFTVPLSYPRRENGLPFHDLVLKIRKVFFA